jgi:predicted Zn-dependent protease
MADGDDPTEIANGVIGEYRADDPAARVKDWQARITHPSGNPKFKEFQAERLREWETTEFAKYRVDDPQVTTLLAEVIRPVLRLYRREGCFKLIIIDHPTPVAMNDSGVILMFSTGLIERATSDDDLLGHTAHEVGHDLFWRRTAQARQSLELYRTKGVGTTLTERQALEELLKIELECDAFSTVTLAAIGRNPLPMLRFHEAVGRDYPDYTRPDLPPDTLRAKVIEGVAPADAYRVTPQTTAAFKKLKATLAAR